MPELFKPPKLADGIQAQAATRHLKREFWRLKVQEDLCPALARNASALTLIAVERQKNDSEASVNIENLLVESSVLTANAIWQETQSRKTLHLTLQLDQPLRSRRQLQVSMGTRP